jgi:hypothetical protein
MQNTIAATAHTCEPSERAFGRRAPGCLRCDELKAGAPARAGWQQPYFARKAREEAQRRNARPHNCRESNCGPICTYGDW